MVSEYIDLAEDGAVATNNAKKLTSMSGDLPPRSEITQVAGNRTEDASAWVTQLVETRSTQIAARVEAIRSFVANNAQALNNAVEALRAQDKMSARDAKQTTSLIEDAGAPTKVMGNGGSSGSAATSKNAFRF